MNTTYRVTYTIEVDAEDPTAAAELTDWLMQRENPIYKPHFTVLDPSTGMCSSIDLEEQP
jgi:hypothetical protein